MGTMHSLKANLGFSFSPVGRSYGEDVTKG